MTFHTFDADDVMQEFGDATVVSELVAIVRADLESYVTRLESAAASADEAGVREVAHAIKGAVANVSAAIARDLAASIENGIRTKQPHVLAQVPQLALECRRLRAELGLWLDSLGQSPAAH